MRLREGWESRGRPWIGWIFDEDKLREEGEGLLRENRLREGEGLWKWGLKEGNGESLRLGFFCLPRRWRDPLGWSVSMRLREERWVDGVAAVGDGRKR